jgi:hypothetical protein
MRKISEELGAPELPDVSGEKNCRENFASAFADDQFGRKQTTGRKGLQKGRNRGLKINQPYSKRLTQYEVFMPATAPEGYCRNQKGYVPIVFNHPRLSSC